jgi:glutamate racemase
MKIGVFDSGLGGLIIAKALIDAMPQYDYAYLGDTANLPYGSRSPEVIYDFTVKSVDYLMRVQECAIVVIACNTATIAALGRLQREYLPAHYPTRQIFGVIDPTVEEVAARGFKRVGLMATASTVNSGAYEKAIRKVLPMAEVVAKAAPLLVALIENGGDKYAPAVLDDYLLDFEDCAALVLACTHYPHYKDLIRLRLPHTEVISQDEIIPAHLADYLQQHKEITGLLSSSGVRFFGVTDMTASYVEQAGLLFEGPIELANVIL